MKQLQRGDDTYRRLFGDEDLAVFVMSEGIEDCNDSACRLFGRTREELRGQTPLDISPLHQPDGVPSLEAGKRRIEAALAGLPQSFVWAFRRADGEPVETLVQMEAIRLDSKVRLFNYVRDLSQLWRAEASLKETETRLEQILEHTSSVVVAKDLQGNYLFANPTIERLVGVPVKQLIGRPIREHYPSDVVERFEEHDRRVLEERRAIEVEEQTRVNGEERTYLVNKFPLLAANGEPYAICGIGTDITDRKRTEDALRQAALAVSAPGNGAILEHLVRSLAAILKTSFSFIAVFTKDDPSTMRTLALVVDGAMHACTDYALAGTPCAQVARQAFRYFPRGVAKQFPDDPFLAQLGLEGYAGFPLNDASGEPIGVIAVMSRKPLQHVELCESILKIFAGRAAAEIERDRAEQALRQSEASYRAIFDESEDAIFVHDWDTGAIVDVNPKACEADGYSRDEMLRTSVGDISAGEHPFTDDEAARLLHQAKEGPVRVEWRARHRSGQLAWKEICLKPARIGGVPRILAFSRDINARKTAEEALRASEEQYRAIFNASVDGLALRDEHLRVVDVNPAIERITGYHREDILGTGRTPFVPDDMREEADALHRRALAGEPVHFETRRRCKNGSVVDIELHDVPIRYQGKPHLLTIARDVTERKLAEHALRASEEQYRAIFKASLDGLVLFNTAGKVVDVNPSFLAMTAFAREESLGADFAVFLPMEERNQCIERVFDPVLAGSPCHTECRAVRADGTQFEAEVRTVAIQYQGRPHILSIIRDITQRKNAEVQRAQLEGQLRQAQKMEALGHLTGGIAHDFNNILMSIMGSITLAAERQSRLADAKVKTYLDRALRSSERARDLIQQMLTFSRGQRGDPRPVSLGQLVEESVSLLRSTLPSTLELKTDAAADAPLVLLDPVQAEQVLLNLCINARDATNASGVVSIGVRALLIDSSVCSECRKPVAGSFVELSVQDDGTGINPGVIERIFEPFFSTKDVGKGSGMGLATVHGIVHECGGHVLVDSVLGQGTTFRVLFPQHETAPGSQAPSEPQVESGGVRATLSGQVLVVDDEEMVIELMRDLLEGWGLVVTTATNGIAALDAFARDPSRFDLVITDQTMPRMTGLALTGELLSIRSTLPVILYTGYSDGLTDEEARAAGVKAFLRKPVVPRDLLAVVRAHLSRSRAGSGAVRAG